MGAQSGVLCWALSRRVVMSQCPAPGGGCIAMHSAGRSPCACSLPWLRRRLVEQLWERTSGVLVLVEPGTPAGSSHIQRARTQLLELAAREAQQQQQRGQPQAGAVGSDGAAEAAGAHVVAPCPHDGPCPLERRASWCHFVQRFQASCGV